MKKRVVINILAIIPFIISCDIVKKTIYVSDPPVSEYLMKINHYRTACLGESETLCYLIQSEADNNMNSSSWQMLYQDIQGLSYEPGFIYTIRVRSTEIEEAHTSGSTRTYEMLELVSTETVATGTKFTINLKFDRTIVFLTGDCSSGLSLAGQVQVILDDAVDCAPLVADIADDSVTRITGTFVHDVSGAIKLKSYVTAE